MIAAGSYIFPTEWITLLYLFPIAAAASFLNRPLIVVAAFACALLRVVFLFQPQAPDSEAVARILFGTSAFAAPGLCIHYGLKLRQRTADQEAMLRSAQEEARILLESSPAAVVTVEKSGQILLANQAARRLLGLDDSEGRETGRSGSSASADGGELPDPPPPARQLITHYVPALQQVLRSPKVASFVRTMVEGSARNSKGEPFFVQMWISSYDTGSGPRVAVIFSDASESLRDREELGLQQLLTSSQIVVGAVSHEIRNLSAAASVLHSNLQKRLQLAQDPDFNALGTLIASLRSIAASEIPSFEERTSGVELNALLEELRIIVSGSFKDESIELFWEVQDKLPRVRADRPALLQVLLNVVQNARQAVQGRWNAAVKVTAYTLEGGVIISVADTGPGLSAPERAFQPFQPGATSNGLGLYVSRAIVRTFGGELAYDNRASGGCFVVHLQMIAGAAEKMKVART